MTDKAYSKLLIYLVLSLVNLYRVTDSLEEILKGLRCYFDKALPVMLLYNNERKQYEESVSGGVSPSTVYGAEHLLRLFGKASFCNLQICLYHVV